VFVCTSYRLVSWVPQAFEASWYYSTASSLEPQDWTAPQLIRGSLLPVAQPCGAGGIGFDGFYPSFMSPGMPPDHLSETRQVFYLDGCNLGPDRKFKSRAFIDYCYEQSLTIVADAPQLAGLKCTHCGTTLTVANGPTDRAGHL
jgi:hypothetical protein